MTYIFKNTPLELHLQYELSYILVPLSVILYYYFVPLRPILYHIVIIAIIGTIDTIYKMNKHGFIIYILSIVFHLILLLVLLDFNKYGFNIYSFYLLLLANLVIVYLPYWPYKIDRNTMLIMYNALYIMLLFIKYRTSLSHVQISHILSK